MGDQQGQSAGHPISPLPPPPPTRTLKANEGPLVWIDCEMTGLDPRTERIIEIACIITDGQLNELDEGVTYVIKQDKAVLDAMGEWCTRQHGQSGLTAACLSAQALAHADVRAAILTYVKERIPQARVACLAGNTVHADAAFLKGEMPELMQHLHYRIVDVSSIKELVSRWYGPQSRWQAGKGEHRALEDIRGSIAELRHYRKEHFTPKLFN
ncbi:ribonuclease H-like protein [Ceraceosorus guamensis]|uniref:Ribonuclease H-like protein n=1 Tax=Ceraceosorus guamensis TaxID=1522189 RepID=A0A316W6R0_9BASI|nr:ribonuclease H-like protein [Ceraceosorus guamensis]PWN45294.1 ribonuclease H-like protein [Ceraceosorus guamensis]